MDFVSLQGVTHTYRDADGTPELIVDGFDWHIGEGEFHCLVGRSGCGKTTLLKLVAGLLLPDRGLVTLQGTVIRGPGAQVGFVFQRPTLLEWLSVAENILLPISLKRRPGPADFEKLESLLALVGLSGLGERNATQLSGGQQSRVAIARALILEPPVLLLDEPFAALDAITREELQDDLLKLFRLRNTTVLFVTHDIREAVYLADRVAVMERGRLKRDLTIALPRPRDREIRYSHEFNELCADVRHSMDEPA
jgi:NitT/TauT family transport system ATP-binding protein